MSIEVICPSISNIVDEFRRYASRAADGPEYVQAANTYKSALVREHWKVLNAISIPDDLKRNVTLQIAMKAFKRRLAPLRAFSTGYSNLPLQGTNIVGVPYFALVTDASTDFNAGNGYVMGDGTQGAKPVTVNKRKYQPLQFSSAEFSRQPALRAGEIVSQKADKLAADVVADVLSLITLENYGAHSFAGAAGTFDADSVADLKGVADVANWPELGRSLVVKSAYDVNLLKDDSVKNAMAYGGSEAIREGKVPILHGFEYHVCDTVPANGENLVGMIAHKSAALVALAPVLPAPDVKVEYEMVDDPDTGLVLEWRRWGNPDMDQARQVIECNYGFAVGEAAALKRMVSEAPEPD